MTRRTLVADNEGQLAVQIEEAACALQKRKMGVRCAHLQVMEVDMDNVVCWMIEDKGLPCVMMPLWVQWWAAANLRVVDKLVLRQLYEVDNTAARGNAPERRLN